MDIKSLNRRDYMTGGAALAASMLLPGCGGGGGDGSEEIHEIGGLLTGSQNVINSSGTTRQMWFVEVHHRGVATVSVSLGIAGSSGQSEVQLSSKSVGYRQTPDAFPLDYATLDNTPSNKADLNTVRTTFRDNMYLKVVIDGETQHVGKYVTTSTRVLQNVYQSVDGKYEHEYLFTKGQDASESSWVVAVTFHRAQVSEMDTRRPNFISEVVQDNSHHAHNHGLTTSYPVVHSGHVEDYKYIAGVLENSETAADSLVLPHTRRGLHKCLVRPLNLVQSSATAAKHHRRRLARHLDEYARHIRSGSATTAANLTARFQRLHNEMMKVMYGGTVTKYIRTMLYDTMSSIQAQTDDGAWTVNSAVENLMNQVVPLDTDANWTEVQRALQNLPLQNSNAIFGVGGGAGVSVQVRADQTFVTTVYNTPLQAHRALRASILLARAGGGMLSTATGLTPYSSTYRIKNRNAVDFKGYKLSLTFVIGPKTGWTAMTGDIEFTVGTTLKKNVAGNWRLRVDSVIADPVLDFDNRSWMTQRLEKMAGYLIEQAVALNQSGDPAALAQPYTGAASAQQWAAIAGATTGFVNALMTTEMAQAIQARMLGIASEYGRTWSMIEIATVRFGVFNSDSYLNFSGSFRGGWKGGWEMAVYPGVKYLAGTGFELPVSTSVKGVVRIFGGADAFFAYGSEGVQGALGGNPVTGTP